MQIGCRGTCLACDDLSFWLFAAGIWFYRSVVFPCQPRQRVQLSGPSAAKPASGSSGTSLPQKLFASGLCPRRCFVGTATPAANLVAGSVWAGQVCMPALDLQLSFNSLPIIDQSLINSTTGCWSF